MTTKERMVRSQTSSDLGERKDGELGDIDIVRATGMVAQSSTRTTWLSEGRQLRSWQRC